jgi:hypothetical protein
MITHCYAFFFAAAADAFFATAIFAIAAMPYAADIFHSPITLFTPFDDSAPPNHRFAAPLPQRRKSDSAQRKRKVRIVASAEKSRASYAMIY